MRHESKTRERELRQLLRFLQLGARVADRPAEADPDEAIAFEDVQRTAYVRADPECFVAKIGDLLRRRLFSSASSRSPLPFSDAASAWNVSFQNSFGSRAS